MSLTELQVRQAKPKEKPYMIRDDDGLYLEVIPAGGKYWRLRYWKQGKEKKMSLGVYPAVGLREAREKRDGIKKDLAHGLDPQAKLTPVAVLTFETVAREWFEKRIRGVKAETTQQNAHSRLERFLLPYIGNRPIKEVMAPEILAALRAIESRGLTDTVHAVHQICGQIFRYAIATGQAERNPAADLQGALTPSPRKHNASITDPQKVRELIRVMGAFSGSEVVRCALWFSAYTFARPGEVRHAEWAEINPEDREWRIPAEKMKMRRQHLVPLADQTYTILKHMKPLTGHGRYIFPSIRSAAGTVPMSENTITGALRRLGFTKEEMTAHGFRSMASTLLHEQGWPSDAIERQLSHVEGNSVKAAYNYAEHLPERRKMMQAWADWLDGLRG